MIHQFFHRLIFVVFIGPVILSCSTKKIDYTPRIEGELKQWHKITFTFTGPEASETDSFNPFLDYRMEIRFYKNDRELIIPGYFAADGHSAETGATSGNKWQVIFCPEDYGLWNYKTTFLHGKNIAVEGNPEEAEKSHFDG
jgi:hypothetical protein